MSLVVSSVCDSLNKIHNIALLAVVLVEKRVLLTTFHVQFVHISEFMSFWYFCANGVPQSDRDRDPEPFLQRQERSQKKEGLGLERVTKLCLLHHLIKNSTKKQNSTKGSKKK